jgi:hypothetical protein
MEKNAAIATAIPMPEAIAILRELEVFTPSTQNFQNI